MFCIPLYERKYPLDKFGEGEIIWSYFPSWAGLLQRENQSMMRMKTTDLMLYEQVAIKTKPEAIVCAKPCNLFPAYTF